MFHRWHPYGIHSYIRVSHGVIVSPKLMLSDKIKGAPPSRSLARTRDRRLAARALQRHDRRLRGCRGAVVHCFSA